MDPSEVVLLIRQFKQRLLIGEQATTARMITAWQSIEAEIMAYAEALALEIENARLSGKPVKRWHIMRMERYQSLIQQVQVQIGQFAGETAGPIIEGAQSSMVTQATGDAAEAINTIRNTGIAFDALNAGAVENLVGLAGDGSPLRDILVKSSGTGADGILRELVNGAARGLAPRVIARNAVRNGFSQSLNQMLTVARTETLRAYRESSRQAYEASGIVPGFMRLATQDDRVCPACMMADGERYDVGETLREHPSGRCALVPIVDGANVPQWTRGKDWFLAQPPQTQRDILGDGRFEAWKDKKFDLDQLVTVRKSSVWGDSIQPTPLKELVSES